LYDGSVALYMPDKKMTRIYLNNNL